MTVLLITYYEMQKNYRINLNKVQIISDLRCKKYDTAQLNWITPFNIKRLITALEQVFGAKNDLNLFLEFYLHHDHFNVVNVICSPTSLQENTRSVLEMREFLKLINVILSQCNKDYSKLRSFVLVKKDDFDNYYKNLLLEKNRNLTENQVSILAQSKKAELREFTINCPNLCFIYEEQYLLLNLSEQ